jgi:hypothetical protein
LSKAKAGRTHQIEKSQETRQDGNVSNQIGHSAGWIEKSEKRLLRERGRNHLLGLGKINAFVSIDE